VVAVNFCVRPPEKIKVGAGKITVVFLNLVESRRLVNGTGADEQAGNYKQV